MGLRLLITLIGIGLVILLIRNSYRKYLASQIKSKQTRPAEDMVQCKYCGTHLPKKEAIQKDDLFFCGKKHLIAYNEDKDD